MVAPQFEGIDVTAGGVHVAPGGWLQGQQPIRLTLTYLNRDEANPKSRRRRRTRWGMAGGAAAPVGGAYGESA